MCDWINELFSEENKIAEHCWKLGRWQDPPHINKVKQYTVLSFKVSLFIQSWKPRQSVCLVCLGRRKRSANEDLSLLINISSPKLECSFKWVKVTSLVCVIFFLFIFLCCFLHYIYLIDSFGWLISCTQSFQDTNSTAAGVKQFISFPFSHKISILQLDLKQIILLSLPSVTERMCTREVCLPEAQLTLLIIIQPKQGRIKRGQFSKKNISNI